MSNVKIMRKSNIEKQSQVKSVAIQKVIILILVNMDYVKKNLMDYIKTNRSLPYYTNRMIKREGKNLIRIFLINLYTTSDQKNKNG